MKESTLREGTNMVSFQRMKEDFDDISTQVEIPSEGIMCQHIMF